MTWQGTLKERDFDLAEYPETPGEVTERIA
jgi:hypothetical protein